MNRSSLVASLALVLATSAFACSAPVDESDASHGAPVGTSTQAETADFGSQCATAGGAYTGSACKCGDGSYVNPYVATCAAAPLAFPEQCATIGATYTGSACQCPDGRYVNPYAPLGCTPPPPVVILPPPPPPPTFAEKCVTAGGVANGSACECAAEGVEYVEATIDPTITTCQKIVRTGNAPVSIQVCGRKYALNWSPLGYYGDYSGYGANALVSQRIDMSGIACKNVNNAPFNLGDQQISWNAQTSEMRCVNIPGLWSYGNFCMMTIEDAGNFLSHECGCY